MAEKLPASQRIVITGMGAISPLGLNVEESWNAIVRGESGIDLIEPPEKRHSKVHIAGQVKGFDLGQYLPDIDLKRIHRSAQFSTAATIEALTDAGLFDTYQLKVANIDPTRIGLRIGSGVAGSNFIAEIQNTLRDRGDSRVSPFSLLQLLIERVDTVPGMRLGIKGPVAATVAACSTASISITDAIKSIKDDEADVMVAGGVETSVEIISISSFASMRALSTRNDSPKEASRPFDAAADGFVMAEGAGVVVLERLDHAVARGANIRAEIVGYSNTSDAYHDTAPSGDGAYRAMSTALSRACLGPEEVDYINAHGTSTPVGDGVELDAIVKALDGKVGRVLISSTKSAVGHLLGAAGGFEAIMCVKAIEESTAPPTLNLRNPIREGLNLVPLQAARKLVDVAFSNAFGFGGINSVLVFKRYTGV